MKRMFASDSVLIHDPATGLTHMSPEPLPTGRMLLAEETVMAWPVASPGQMDRAMPASVCWSPIVHCNLHCPQCLDDTTVKELDAPGRARIAAVLSSSELLGVDISGGEPLLLRDLIALAHRVAGGGRTTVSVTTNGWHLARKALALGEAVDAIRVSLDGPDEQTHDRIRGKESFGRACAGIETAVAAGIPVQVQTVLMRRNHESAQQVVDLAASLGAGGVTFLQMLPIGAGAGLRGQMLTDHTATAVLEGLRTPPGLRLRLRTRESAGGFTVVRADGLIYRNDLRAMGINGLRPLTEPKDLALTGRDGSA